MNLIDLVAILPFYLTLVVGDQGSGLAVRVSTTHTRRLLMVTSVDRSAEEGSITRSRATGTADPSFGEDFPHLQDRKIQRWDAGMFAP